MKHLALFAFALSTTALAQGLPTDELRQAKNAASRAEDACKKNNAAKCRTDTLAAEDWIKRAKADPDLFPPTPTPSPTPTPVPTPTPTPTSGYVPSPSLNGAPDLVATFPVTEGLTRSGNPIPGIYDVNEGAFRLTCGGDGELNYDDMLLYPGQVDESHLHKYFGAFGVNANTTMADLAKVTRSNCNSGTDKVVNRSAYWIPAMLDDLGYVRNPDWIALYYKRFRSVSPQCTPGSPVFMGRCLGLPNQIRFIAGWDPTKPDQVHGNASWYCSGGTAHYRNLDDLFASGLCKPGADLIADVTFPNCWNPDWLDTPDHRSHMAFASYGDWGYLKCPATHPYVIPQTEYKYKWTITADMIGTRADGSKYSRVRLSSDHMKPNAKPGETLHGDYAEQWVGEAKRMWHDNCIEKGLNCSGGDLGNGWLVTGGWAPQQGWTNPNPKSSTTYADMAP
jgi:hypothetical protein